MSFWRWFAIWQRCFIIEIYPTWWAMWQENWSLWLVAWDLSLCSVLESTNSRCFDDSWLADQENSHLYLTDSENHVSPGQCFFWRSGGCSKWKSLLWLMDIMTFCFNDGFGQFVARLHGRIVINMSLVRSFHPGFEGWSALAARFNRHQIQVVQPRAKNQVFAKSLKVKTGPMSEEHELRCYPNEFKNPTFDMFSCWFHRVVDILFHLLKSLSNFNCLCWKITHVWSEFFISKIRMNFTKKKKKKKKTSLRFVSCV